MKIELLIMFSLILSQMQKIEGRSEEFNQCVNLENPVVSSSDCTNIKIPEYEGYKCCSMKITFNNESTYSCLTIENKYTSLNKPRNVK